MKPYIEPKDKAKYEWYHKGYLKGFISEQTFIEYCQSELTALMQENKEILERLKQEPST